MPDDFEQVADRINCPALKRLEDTIDRVLTDCGFLLHDDRHLSVEVLGQEIRRTKELRNVNIEISGKINNLERERETLQSAVFAKFEHEGKKLTAKFYPQK